MIKDKEKSKRVRAFHPLSDCIRLDADPWELSLLSADRASHQHILGVNRPCGSQISYSGYLAPGNMRSLPSLSHSGVSGCSSSQDENDSLGLSSLPEISKDPPWVFMSSVDHFEAHLYVVA